MSDNGLDQNFRDTELEEKFQIKPDLHEYMLTKLGIFLPDIRYCRLSFLQDIILDEKRHMEQVSIQYRHVPKSYPEFAVKNVWPQVRSHIRLRKYLPSEEMDLGRFPDRFFFWQILFSIVPEWAQMYFSEVLNRREEMRKKDFRNKRLIQISPEWKQKLTQYSFVSRKTGRGKQSFLIRQTVKPYKKREERQLMRKVIMPIENDPKYRKSTDPSKKQEVDDTQILANMVNEFSIDERQGKSSLEEKKSSKKKNKHQAMETRITQRLNKYSTQRDRSNESMS